MTQEKIKALANYLDCNESDIQETEENNLFEFENEQYLVLTGSEADEKASDEILNTLWAFNADFIIRHCRNYEDMSNFEYEAAIDSLKKAQEQCCENANGLVAALIDDMQDFIEDAICEDGRGHFISWYDGDEIEQGDYYIYRIN